MSKHKNLKTMDDLVFEITCRKILVKRLESPHTILSRAVEKENVAFQERAKTLSQYETEQEAHDAYGYGDITWEEYEDIKRQFENAQHAKDNPTTPKAAALEMLKEFIGQLKSEIRWFEWDALPAEEKQRIERENLEFKERTAKRRETI